MQAEYVPQSAKCENIPRGFPMSTQFLDTSLLFPGNSLGLLAMDKNYKLVLTPDVSTIPLTTDVEDYIGRLRECKPNIRLKTSK